MSVIAVSGLTIYSRCLELEADYLRLGVHTSRTTNRIDLRYTVPVYTSSPLPPRVHQKLSDGFPISDAEAQGAEFVEPYR